jgi:hypothetical protein
VKEPVLDDLLKPCLETRRPALRALLKDLPVSVLYPLAEFGITVRSLDPRRGARSESASVRAEIEDGGIYVDQHGRERTSMGERINGLFDLPARTIYIARAEKAVMYHEVGRAVQYMLGYTGKPGKMNVSSAFVHAYESGEAVSPYAQRSITSAYAQTFATYFGACNDTFGGDVRDRRHGWDVLMTYAPQSALHLHETVIRLDAAYHQMLKREKKNFMQPPGFSL